MIDAYEIGASIVLDDKITGQLSAVDGQLSVVEASIKRINDLLGTTTGLMSSLSGSARGMASAWNAAANAAERMQVAAAKINAPGAGGGGGGGGFIGGGGYLPFDDSGRPNFTMSGNDYDGVPRLPAPPMSIFGPGGPGGGGRNGNGSGDDGGQRGGFSPMNAMSSIFVAQAGAGLVSRTVGGFVAPSFSIQDQLQNSGPASKHQEHDPCGHGPE